MEYRANSTQITKSIGRAFYPVAIASVVLVLLTVSLTLGPNFAVFGLYALLGLAGSAALYYGFDSATAPPNWEVDASLYRLGVFAACALTIGVVALTGAAVAVVLGLAVGYTLVVAQLLSKPAPERLLPQLSALFLLSPIAKYVTSGQYIGHGDLLFHTRVVEDLMASGSIASIGYASYQEFPGLHLVASSLGSLAGVAPDDAIMLTGLAVYAILIPAVYLVVVRITDHPMLALCTAFALVLLDDLSFFASYVFPQALAIAMVLILAVLVTLATRDDLQWPVAASFGVLAVVLSLTHHLTQVLVLPVVALGVALYAFRGPEYLRSAISSRPMGLIAFAAGVSAIRLVQTGFVDRLVAKAGQMLQGGPQGGYTQGSVFAFGRPPRSDTVGTALEWLLSPYGVYLTVLVLVFSLGVVAYMRTSGRPVAQQALFGCGVVGALVVFETPISIQSLIRIRMPWLFVFAFVVALGILQLIRYAGRRPTGLVVLALVVGTAAMAPMVTADDYYDMDPRPTMQSSFSDQEMAELRAASGYVESREGSVAGFWLTDKVMERYGGGLDRVRVADGEVVLPAGYFVYRSQWPGNKVHFTAGNGDELYGNTLYVAADWLDQRVQRTNKVYSAGETSLGWGPSERPF